MKKAIVVTSFGTSHMDASEKYIVPVEQAIQKEMPDWDIFRAFTSNIIIKKLQQQENSSIQRPESILSDLAASGYEQILVQPTHILPGKEYHDVKEEVLSFARKYPTIKVALGEPLFYRHTDYISVVEAMQSTWPLCQEDERLLLFGHGTDHFSNACYFELQYVLNSLYDRALVSTVEATPSLENAIDTMKKQNIRSVYLTPLMLVSGDHVKNDMMGTDEDSWKNQLKKEGFKVNVLKDGLGKNPNIIDLYVKKTQNTAKVLSNES